MVFGRCPEAVSPYEEGSHETQSDESEGGGEEPTSEDTGPGREAHREPQRGDGESREAPGEDSRLRRPHQVNQEATVDAGGLRVKTRIRAGKITYNHNEAK
jgi:hypothetical protein